MTWALTQQFPSSYNNIFNSWQCWNFPLFIYFYIHKCLSWCHSATMRKILFLVILEPWVSPMDILFPHCPTTGQETWILIQLAKQLMTLLRDFSSLFALLLTHSLPFCSFTWNCNCLEHAVSIYLSSFILDHFPKPRLYYQLLRNGRWMYSCWRLWGRRRL